MPVITIRLLGDNCPVSKRIQLSLDSETPFDQQQEALCEATSFSSIHDFKLYKFDVKLKKVTGPIMDFALSPGSNSLHNKDILYVKKERPQSAVSSVTTAMAPDPNSTPSIPPSVPTHTQQQSIQQFSSTTKDSDVAPVLNQSPASADVKIERTNTQETNPSRSNSAHRTSGHSSEDYVVPPLPPGMTREYAMYRARLIAFYKMYNPEKLPNVDAALNTYTGREQLMFERLAEKYGPEPVETTARDSSPGGGARAARPSRRRAETILEGSKPPSSSSPPRPPRSKPGSFSKQIPSSSNSVPSTHETPPSVEAHTAAPSVSSAPSSSPSPVSMIPEQALTDLRNTIDALRDETQNLKLKYEEELKHVQEQLEIEKEARKMIETKSSIQYQTLLDEGQARLHQMEEEFRVLRDHHASSHREAADHDTEPERTTKSSIQLLMNEVKELSTRLKTVVTGPEPLDARLEPAYTPAPLQSHGIRAPVPFTDLPSEKSVTQEELLKWMLQLGLSHYTPNLLAAELDITTIPFVTDEDLQTMGVTTIGARRKLLAAARILTEDLALRSSSGWKHSSSMPTASALQVSHDASLPPSSALPSVTDFSSYNINAILRGSAAAAVTGSSGQKSSNVFDHRNVPLDSSIPAFAIRDGGGRSTRPSLPQQLREHISLLESFYTNHDPPKVPEVPKIVMEFSTQLPSMYSSIASIYCISFAASTRELMIRHLKDIAPFMVPAVDVILDTYWGRESEYLSRLAARHT